MPTEVTYPVEGGAYRLRPDAPWLDSIGLRPAPDHVLRAAAPPTRCVFMDQVTGVTYYLPDWPEYLEPIRAQSHEWRRERDGSLTHVGSVDLPPLTSPGGLCAPASQADLFRLDVPAPSKKRLRREAFAALARRVAVLEARADEAERRLDGGHRRDV